MAEVAGAIFGGLGQMAMAAAAISVAAIGYAIFQQVWTLIPWAGSAMLGASWALMFTHIDPILAIGGALGLAAFIYPALEIFTAQTSRGSSKPMAMPAPSDIAQSMQGVSAIMATGIAGGVTHLVTKNLPASLIAAGAAGFLASKYAAGPLFNFYIEIGFMGSLACKASGADSTNCVSPCTKTALKAEYDAWLNGPGGACKQGTVDPAWCQAWEDYYSKCSWQRGKKPDLSPGASTGSAKPSLACQKAGTYKTYGMPKFENVCTNEPFTLVYWQDAGDSWNFQPVPIDPAKWQRYDPTGQVTMHGPGLGCYNGPAGTTFNPNLHATHGYIKSCADGVLTCMYEGVSNNWQMGSSTGTSPAFGNPKIVDSVSMTGTQATAAYGFVNYDLSDPKNADINKRAGNFRGQNVCIASSKKDNPVTGKTSFIAHTDLPGGIQPLDADQPKFCGAYNKETAKAGDFALARVYPYIGPDNAPMYQCKSSMAGGLQPAAPLPWPKL